MNELDSDDGNEGFKRLGAARVRLLLAGGGLPKEQISPAAEWLADIDEREKTRLEAIQYDQVATAKSTQKAAWLAAWSAVAAVIIGLGILVALLLGRG